VYQYSLPFDLLNPADPLEEVSLYHHPDNFGFTAILRKTGAVPVDGSLMPIRPQRSYRMAELPEVLKRIETNQDIWIAQNEFIKPNRRLVNLGRITSCYVDLDFYKLNHPWVSAEHAAHALIEHLNKLHIPLPSLIIDSGRGLQVKWLLEPLPAKALPRWQAVQRTLAAHLESFGADKRALDASRVLRLVGTTNTRSGRLVTVIYANTVKPIEFDAFANAILPFTREELQQRKASRLQVIPTPPILKQEAFQTAGLRQLSVRTLWWDRLADIRTLAALRGWTGNVPEGHRAHFLWIACVALCWTMPLAWVKNELSEIGLEFASSMPSHERMAMLSTTLARAEAAAKGETISYQDQMIDPRYRISNQRLIELLEITAEEERQLKTIISKSTKRERDRLKKQGERRESGVMERGIYLENAETKRASARIMKAQGKTWKEIAEELGYASAVSARLSCKQN